MQTQIPPVPARPDAVIPVRSRGRSIALVGLNVALAIQLMIGLVYFIVGGLGGGPEFTWLMLAWGIGLTLIVVALVLVTRRHLRPAFGWVAPIAVAFTLGAWPVVTNGSFGVGPCSEAARSTIQSIPTYDGSQVEPTSFQGTCSYTSETTDQVDRVFAHYRSLLEADGWTITEMNQQPGTVEGGGSFSAGQLSATRNGEHFFVSYEEVEGTSQVSVQVS